MAIELKYGLNSTLRFETGLDAGFVECRSDAAPLFDLPAAVEQALTHPLDFPSFQQAVLPGDKLVLALDAQVPQGPEVVRAVVSALMKWGAALEDITVLVATEECAASLREASHVAERRATLVVHDPAKRDQMAYLTSTQSGEPLYLNRLLCDADMVIPIGSARMFSRAAKAKAKAKVSDGLYPVFSAAKAQPAARVAQRSRRARPKPDKDPAERPDVSWLLGVLCMVQVVPGPGGSASAVLAGEPAAVRRESRRQCEAAWRFEVPQPASLVIAAIEGDASQQTWEHVSRSLAAATQAVAEEGSIAICCDLQEDPGPALQALAEYDDRHAALRAIRRAQPPDARIAARLVRACDRARVYLLSQLADDVVEALGMAPIQEAAEVARLALRHESCLLLSNAQHALVIPQE